MEIRNLSLSFQHSSTTTRNSSTPFKQNVLNKILSRSKLGMEKATLKLLNKNSHKSKHRVNKSNDTSTAHYGFAPKVQKLDPSNNLYIENQKSK